MTWKYKALLHAQREDPRESCGLLLNVKGKERYYPCRNLSITDNQCFIIDPEDYVKADNVGEIVCYLKYQVLLLERVEWEANHQNL